MLRDDTSVGLARNIASGDNDSLGVLADRLLEMDHPAGELLHRIWRGEGVEGDPYRQHILGTVHAGTVHGTEASTPSYYPVLPLLDPETHTGTDKTGRISVRYLSLPDRHWWLVGAGHGENPQDSRSWLVPVLPGELESHQKSLTPWTRDQFSNLNPPRDTDGPYYEDRLRRAGVHPDQLSTRVNESPHQLSRSRGLEPVPPLTLALSDPGSAAEYGPRALSAVRGMADRREKDRFQRRVVSRFGRAPGDEVLGIAAQQREHGGGYDPHNQSDMILADKLADHGDPLETVVRRDLSYRIPGHSGVSGFNSRVDRHATELGGAGSPLGQSIHVAEYELPVGTLNLGRYGDDGKGNALSYYVNWLPPYPGGSYAAAMSPEETIHLLNEHGVPHDLKPPFRSTGTGPEHLSRRPRRYSATEGDVQNLLSQIATNPEHQQPGSHLRLVAADALQERGRDREADVLRNHRHLVYVEGGRVLRDFHLPVTHQQTALDWHGGGGSELYGIGSTGNVTGESARRALEEIDDIRNDYGNSEELSNPDNRRGLDRLYDHLSRIERETADERKEEPEHLSRTGRIERYASYYKNPAPEPEPEPEFPQDHDPDEGDYFITTHGDEHRVHQHGHEVMRFPVDTGDAEIQTRLREHADQEQFWPDAWMIYSPNSHDHYPYSRRRKYTKDKDAGEALREAAFRLNDELELGPDYQRLFWNPDTKTAWYVTGDADQESEVKKVGTALEGVSGVDHVRVEAEHFPPEDGGWVEMYDRNNPDEGWVPWPPSEKKSRRRPARFALGANLGESPPEPSDDVREMLRQHRENPDDQILHDVLLDKIMDDHGVSRNKARALKKHWLEKSGGVPRRRYTAYRAPTGGMISRGTHQPGGQFVPDLNGEFMRGARRVLGPVQKRESPDPAVSFGGRPKWAEWRRRIKDRLTKYRYPGTTPVARSRTRTHRRPIMFSATGSDVNALLHQLSEPEQNRHRWGLGDPLSGLRGVAADALDEQDRGAEAAVLREPKRHVLIHEGRVVPARFNVNPTETSYDTAAEWVRDNGDEAMLPEVHILGNRTRDQFRAEDMNDPEGYAKRIPRQHVRVVDADQTGADTHAHEDVHLSELKNHLADLLENSVDRFGDTDWGDYDWHTFGQYLDALRNAQYEEPDPAHPMNRG